VPGVRPLGTQPGYKIASTASAQLSQDALSRSTVPHDRDLPAERSPSAGGGEIGRPKMSRANENAQQPGRADRK
jgi:hypothetical protein